MTLMPSALAALTAPSTSAFGARSPPIASTAMVSMAGGGLLLLDLDHFAALILSAVRADTMGELGFMTVGTFGHSRRLQRIVRAAILGAPVGVASFWIRHFSTSRILPRMGGDFQSVSRFRRSRRAAQRAPACSSLQSHGVSLRFLPHDEQIALQSSLQTRCIGMSSRT